ncbi:MAG TPA: hypothetical protein VKU00_20065 [Chthonomonadaceae bacterium]|nr:hypothetical protein [Chthonomonadaceae bacterium]
MDETNAKRGLVVRMVLVAVLALTLVGALRWAMNVTNANAKQISDNIRKVQENLDSNTAQGAQGPTKTDGKPLDNLRGQGPVIGPATNKP